MRKKAGLYLSLLIGSAYVLTGCGGSSSGTQTTGTATPTNSPTTTAPAASPTVKLDETPVTLKVYPRAPLSEQEFQQYFVEPTKKKYPYITLQLMKATTLQEVIASGETPDIIFGSQYYLKEFKQLDLPQDLSAYIKKYNVDLNAFNKEAMEIIKQQADHGEIYSVPFSLNYGALFYNKDIFDKFGVDYPKDLMSLEDLVPIAQRLTRTEDGVSYIGLAPESVGVLINAMGLPFIPENDKPDFNGPAFKKVFDFEQSLYNIPGMIGPDNKLTYGRKIFINEKRIAMLADWTSDTSAALEKAASAGFTNWDIAAYPNFADRLGKGRSVDTHLSVVTKTSKAKEQAFLVMMETVSKDVQMLASANGNISALNDAEIQSKYASNLQSFKGKHVENIFKTTMTVIPKESEYDVTAARTVVNNALEDVALKKKDVNTALREAQDQVELSIASQKAGK